MARTVNWSAMRRSAALLGCLAWLTAGAYADERPFAPPSIPGAVSVTAEELVELVLSRPDLVIIDARMNSEYAKGRIEGAINMLNTSMRREDLEKAVPDLTTPVIIYCNGERCLRSSDAVKKVMEWGYRNVFWFRGGWREWTEKGLPVIVD